MRELAVDRNHLPNHVWLRSVRTTKRQQALQPEEATDHLPVSRRTFFAVKGERAKE